MMGGPFGVSALSPQSLYGLPCSAEVPCGPIRPCAVTIEAVAVLLHWAPRSLPTVVIPNVVYTTNVNTRQNPLLNVLPLGATHGRTNSNWRTLGNAIA